MARKIDSLRVNYQQYYLPIDNRYDGIIKLWNFTQFNKDQPRTDFIFKSTINDNHISYDLAMRSVIKELAETAGLADQTRTG